MDRTSAARVARALALVPLLSLAQTSPANAVATFQGGTVRTIVGDFGGPGLEQTNNPVPAGSSSASYSAVSQAGLGSVSGRLSVMESPAGLVIAGEGHAVVQPPEGGNNGYGAGIAMSLSFCVEDPGGGDPPVLSQRARVAVSPADADLLDRPLLDLGATFVGPDFVGRPHSGEIRVEFPRQPATEATLDDAGESPVGCYGLSINATVSDNDLATTVSFDRVATADFEFELTIGEGSEPPDDECEGEELTWVAGRDGAFANPESWSPPQVPTFEDGGPCDTALVQGGGVVTVDLGSALARDAEPLVARELRGVDRRTGRLHVQSTRELRLQGGTLVLDALSPALGERSLEVSNAGGLLLADGAVAARHVGVGSAPGPGGQIEVVGPGGSLSTTARLGLGGGGEGRLLVRQGGQVSSAESMIGESALGGAVVQDPGSLWRTANVTVGYGGEGSLEVKGGARVESDQGHVGLGLADSQFSTAKVLGADAQGNRATWAAQSLELRNGYLAVEAGGLVDVAGELLLSLYPEAASQLDVRPGGQVAASDLRNDGGLIFVSGDALLFVTGQILFGTTPGPGAGGSLFVTGPASSAQLSGPELLGLDATSNVTLADGARVELLGTFNVGVSAGARASLVVRGARPRESLLRANETDVFASVVGAPSDAPASERLAPTGTLQLEGGRIELVGASHDLQVDRLGRLAAAGGSLSIEAPGVLENHGVVEGPFILEAPYVQGATGTRRATILFEGDPAAAARALDPLAAAAFPRRAARKKPPLPVAGPLVVTGDATLAGRVELQFGNGVAPQAGEAFEVLDVGGKVTGEFAEVAIQGLVPGSFAFEPSLVGGKLALTSTTDAVALPAVSVKAKARLKETAKKGGKIKLKRTGDTSAPLLVAYTVGGSAQSGVDFEALPGTIEIPAKKKSATIVVKPLADGLVEGPETIELELAPNEAFAPGLVSSAGIELLSKDE